MAKRSESLIWPPVLMAASTSAADGSIFCIVSELEEDFLKLPNKDFPRFSEPVESGEVNSGCFNASVTVMRVLADLSNSLFSISSV